ncbi:single-strand selective monofunctional uracil DNA glycosylase-like [Argonauta hians]
MMQTTNFEEEVVKKWKVKQHHRRRDNLPELEGDDDVGDDVASAMTSTTPSGEHQIMHPLSAAAHLTHSPSLPEQFLQLEDKLCQELSQIKYLESVPYIYNPLKYAHDTHANYVHKYCKSTKDVLFLGMNPGPFGMGQNGVPFGARDIVNNWLRIDGVVIKPVPEHVKRPVEGLHCRRNEVSGQRFWGVMQLVCGSPDIFFKNCFVHNICPLLFLSNSGKSLPPPNLKKEARNQLTEVCNRYLLKVVQLLQVKLIICIGNFAYDNTVKAFKNFRDDSVRIGKIMHPSPANPKANKDWTSEALIALNNLDVMKYTNWEVPLPSSDPSTSPSLSTSF